MSARRRMDHGLLQTLSGKPERTWPSLLLHHGSRALLLLGVGVLLTVLFPPSPRVDLTPYEVGMLAEEDVIARIPFQVPKTDEELARDREEAVSAVPPTFDLRPDAAEAMASELEEFFARVEEAREEGPGAVERVVVREGVSATPSQIGLLMDEGSFSLLRSTALRATRELLAEGVLDLSDAELRGVDRIVVRRGEEERVVEREDVLTPRGFYDRAVDLLPFSASPDLSGLLRLILIRHMEYTHSLNVLATELDREAARRSVSTTKADVVAGEAIVRANQQIGERDLERLNAYQRQLQNQGLMEEGSLDLPSFLGSVVLHTLLLGLFGVLLYLFRPEIYGNFRWLLTLAVLLVAYFGFGGVISRQGWPVELLPVAFVSMAVAILWDGRLALILAAVTAALTGILPPFATVGTVATVFVGGAAAALSVRAMRRRAEVWRYIAVVAGAYAAVLIALGVTSALEPTDVALDVAWAAANATLSCILAVGFIPVFEWITGITTDQTLQEWMDPNRPLLRQLSREAPGTYAHTINVSNLAEAAANAIGANGLLCRVGLLYHDVGKMLKPQYFVENQPEGRNPHDKLKPETSASIVREHVIEGLRLAREANVPDVISAFIPEHHGTQQISFFWEKAKEEAGGEEDIDPELFRYPGPRPRSKETAISMLADSVESATRALQDPTADRIRNLIHNVVESKIQAGQLDESPLTLEEIATLKEEFVKILGGMYHQRIDYPQTKHLTDREEGGEPGGGGQPGPPGGGADGGEAEDGEADGGESDGAGEDPEAESDPSRMPDGRAVGAEERPAAPAPGESPEWEGASTAGPERATEPAPEEGETGPSGIRHPLLPDRPET